MVSVTHSVTTATRKSNDGEKTNRRRQDRYYLAMTITGACTRSGTVVTTDCNAEQLRIFCSVMGCKGPEFLAAKQRLKEQEKASDSKVYSIGDVTQKNLLFGVNTHLNAATEPDKANSRHHGYCLVIMILFFRSSEHVKNTQRSQFVNTVVEERASHGADHPERTETSSEECLDYLVKLNKHARITKAHNDRNV